MERLTPGGRHGDTCDPVGIRGRLLREKGALGVRAGGSLGWDGTERRREARRTYPFYDNEEVADEFATAVMVMLKMKKRVLAKAEFFTANPTLSELLAKTFKDDRPLSVQRARNIRRWAKDPNLVHKWQTVFVPHMQTPILEKLHQEPTPWADLALVKKELATRR